MPCKCMTGCYNKKCSCKAKGSYCCDECACGVNNDKYDCFNLPGKEPPVKENSRSRRSSRKSSKSSDYYSDSENEKSLVTNAELVNKQKIDDNIVHQTVIINNYYTHNEFKQQNNYLITPNNGASSNDMSSVPELTDSLAQDFLKFYWECLSSKNKCNFIEKYISEGAELRIQGVPFIGPEIITNRLKEAAPIKINSLVHNIFPISQSIQNNQPKLFSVTNINNKLLNSFTKQITHNDTDKINNNDNNTPNHIVKYVNNSDDKNNNENRSLVNADPNLPFIGKIETKGVMMDPNGNTAQFIQNYHLVYNRFTKNVQIKFSELNWI